MSDGSASWFSCFTPRPDATLRLFGFPHGGGGPQAFREWSRHLPEHIELYALSLPGRGSRLHEPLMTSIDDLMPHLLRVLPDLLDKPFVFFGHSMGAIVAFELTRQLQQEGFPLPLRLFVSAHKAPHMAHGDAPMHRLPDAELVTLLRRLGLVPDAALDSPELMNLILPPLKADYQLSETYCGAARARLSVPITAMGGRHDTLAAASDLQHWSDCANTFALHLFDGDHFYTQACQDDVLQTLDRTIATDMAALAPSVLHGETLPYPDACLHERFRHQAARTPDALAVVGDDTELTFAELDAQTDLLAHHLQQRGVGIDDLVGIYMETSVAFVIAYLAALKAGGAYMPIEVAYPDALLARVLETAQPTVVLTKARFYHRLPAKWQAGALILDEGWQASLQGQVFEPLDRRPQPGLDDLAYCVMSSGTTGAPKGMLCPHRGAVNAYDWRYAYYPYQEDEREACNVFFVWEMLRPLLQGKPVFVIPDEVIYDPPRLVEFLHRHRITRVLFTPSLLEQILNTPLPTLQDQLRYLRVVYLNGEVVSTGLCHRFRELFPRVTLLNDYSISECHDVCTYDLAEYDAKLSPKYAPLGPPMSNVRVYLLDDDLQPVPMGFRGEIYVGGDSLARGYLNEPERTAERFIRDPLRTDGARLFRTGDVGRILPNGHLEIQGRVAFMIKLRGYSIVPGAVESAMLDHPAVRAAVVTTVDHEETGQPEYLVAYVVGNGERAHEALVDELRLYLKANLPHYAVPSFIVPIDALPLGAAGKLDRRLLPKPDLEALRSRRASVTAPPESELEVAIADAWQDLLHTDRIDATENFFDLGGHSLLAAALCARLREALDLQISVVDVFQYPTIRALAHALEAQRKDEPIRLHIQAPWRHAGADTIAVIGLSCRFPGADHAEAFWRNLRDGVCSIHSFSDAELQQAGIPADIYHRDDYVKAGAILDHVDQFDAAFWGISKREAVYMDPQHRLFLEACWQALEDAGYPPSQSGARTGVFAGSFLPLYLLHYLGGGGLLDPTNPALAHLTEIGNDKDYVATRVSYLLNLRGPSVTVQTACSTALVAVAQACQSLLAGECDMALAGASSLTLPHAGYRYLDGFVNSRDGQCRAFDADASGTVLGDGVGVVVLKRLQDARAAGDHIYGLITGYAVNNDGNLKADYSAPSVQGQAEVIATAQAMAGVNPRSISYVEAHGTGTLVGDPIEVRGLTLAFRQGTADKAFCALGSVKPNIGHSNIAAGIAGLIKVLLSMRHGQLPPTIHFRRLNPAMPLEATPFFVNDRLREWTVPDGEPRRAGVSSFGIGGTNCHVVVEEWQDTQAEPSGAAPARALPQILPLSAKTPEALEQGRLNLIHYLQTHATLNLADAAYTLQVGREAFGHRLAVCAHDLPAAIQGLQRAAPKGTVKRALSIVFMFSGQGAQYRRMGADLYASMPAFRHWVETCRDFLKPLIQHDIQQLLDPDAGDESDPFSRAHLLQPALFTVEYALARTLMELGIQPTAVVGHSLGEYVAACIAGVLSLEDALSLVAARGFAMEAAGEGAMLAVKLSEQELHTFLAERGKQVFDDGPDVGVAAVNALGRVVLSGSCQAVAQAKQALRAAGVNCQPVYVNRAFHSPMMAQAAQTIVQHARAVTLNPPVIPLASNLTGTWLTSVQATDPSYWGEHMMQPVRFCDNVQRILAQSPDMLLEVGPGRILSSLAADIQSKVSNGPAPLIAPTMRHPHETETTDTQFLCNTLARLWTAGAPLHWAALHGGQARQRVSLPPYAFVREPCWPKTEDVAVAQRLNPQPWPTERQHPLLGRRQRSAVLKAGERLFEAQWRDSSPAYLTDHRVYGQVIVPGTAFVEMALAAGATLTPAHRTVADMIVYQALPLADHHHVTVQLVLTPTQAEAYAFELWSLSADAPEESPWARHASGRLLSTDTATAQALDLYALQAAFERELSVTDFYQRCEAEQFHYGPRFRRLEQLWQRRGEALGRLVMSEDVLAEMAAYHLHPAFLDVCLQVMWGIFVGESETATYVPVGWDRITLYQAPRGHEFWSHAQLTAVNGPIRTANIDIYDREGHCIASVVGAQEQQTSRLALLANAPWQDWLYTVAWRPQALAAPSGAAAGVGRHWLILTTSEGVGQELTQQLQRHGGICTVVALGRAYEQLDARTFIVRNCLEDLKRVWEALSDIQDVIYLWAHETKPDAWSATALERALRLSCGGALHLLQACLSSHVDRLPPTLWLVTRGAQVVADEGPDIAQAALWGMARVIDLEHPDLACLRLDLDPRADTGLAVQQLCDELLAVPPGRHQRETQVAFRNGTRYVARLARTNVPYQGEIDLQPDATYLITGGLGGLGLRLATWMVSRGARHLVLLGRSPAKPEAQQLLDRLRQQGAQITVAQADVTVAERVCQVLQEIDPSTPLRGIIHAAGVLDDGVLMQQSWERFAPVLAPKVQGAWHLHEQTREVPLDFFVVFSSDAALLGSGGQANHAAANACLDAFAYDRRAHGEPALSISWGGWSEIGAAALPPMVERIHIQGMDLLSPETGLQVLESALQSEVTYLNATPIDWHRFRTYLPSGGPFWADVQRPELLAQCTASIPATFDTADERRQFLHTMVCEHVAQLLGATPAEVGADLHRTFFDLGLDSLTSLELRNSLQTRLGCQLPAAFIFQYPTLEALLDYLERGVMDMTTEEDA